MSLMQIEDEKSSKKIGTHAFVAGIDFGTTQSLIAMEHDGAIRLLADPLYGTVALPSVVWVGKNEIRTGHQAIARAQRDPTQTFYSIKRLLGRSPEEMRELCLKLPYVFARNAEEASAELETDQGSIHPVELAEEVFRTLRLRAEKVSGTPLMGAVLTVPAYFDEVQRKCIKDAAKLAGIRVLRLLSEPTAAALAYLSKKIDGESQKVQFIAVYDFGGGTFDFSVLRVEGAFIEVIATGGDTLLGGDDLDALLAKRLQEEWSENFTSALFGEMELKRQWQHFLKLASEIKIGLSTQEEMLAQYGRWQISVTRDCLEELSMPIVEKSLEIVREVLQRADLSAEKIDEVLLIGGPTRLPFIRKSVEEFFKKSPNLDLDPEGAVALGAAQYAELLSKRLPDTVLRKKIFEKSDKMVHQTLLDVTPLSFGLETLNGNVEVFLPRNTPLPSSCTQEYTNPVANQKRIRFHVVQGESSRALECRSLAHFYLDDLPEKPARGLDISVTFSVDVNGLLTVSAYEKQSGKSHSVITQPTYKIPEDLLEELEAVQDETEFPAPVTSSLALPERAQICLKEIDALLQYAKNSPRPLYAAQEGATFRKNAIVEELEKLKCELEVAPLSEEVFNRYETLCKKIKQVLLQYR